MLFGAAAQFGIFGTLLIATLLGFNINQAASIGIIGAADGPTSIFVASELAPDLVGPITVAAYSLHVAGAGHPAAGDEGC